MIETKKQWRAINKRLDFQDSLRPKVVYRSDCVEDVRVLVKTIEALRKMAQWAFHPDSCKSQMTGDRPCSCGYQELKDALPDWITDG